MSEMDWEIYFWIGEESTVSFTHPPLFHRSYHLPSPPPAPLSLSLSLSFLTSSLPPLFVLSLPLSPLSTSPLSFLLLLFPLSPSPPPLLPPHHRWTRRRVPPCTLSIFVTCWVASDGRTGKKWATNQTLLSISSQKSPTLKVR